MANRLDEELFDLMNDCLRKHLLGRECPLIKHEQNGEMFQQSDSFNRRLAACVQEIENNVVPTLFGLNLTGPAVESLEKRSEPESWVFLLMDPNVQHPGHDCLSMFKQAVFHVGKGYPSHRYYHLYNTKYHDNVDLIKYRNRMKPQNQLEQSLKIDKIDNIWSKGQPVLIYVLFKRLTEKRALAAQACLKHAIGHGNLIKDYGQSANVVQEWPEWVKEVIGQKLLSVAYEKFSVANCESLRREDIPDLKSTWFCYECMENFAGSSDRTDHIRELHGTFRCIICGNGPIETPESFRIHMSTNQHVNDCFIRGEWCDYSW